MCDLWFVSVGQCYTNFERREFWVQMQWCVCVMGMIQRALWEAGMQSRHGVLGRQCLHVPPGLHKTRLLFTHTFTDLSSPQDKEEFSITVCLFTTILNIVLLRNTASGILLRQIKRNRHKRENCYLEIKLKHLSPKSFKKVWHKLQAVKILYSQPSSFVSNRFLRW